MRKQGTRKRVSECCAREEKRRKTISASISKASKIATTSTTTTTTITAPVTCISNKSHISENVNRLCFLIDIFFKYAFPWAFGGAPGVIYKQFEYLKTVSDDHDNDKSTFTIVDSLALVECFPFIAKRYAYAVVKQIGIENAWCACIQTNYALCTKYIARNFVGLCDFYAYPISNEEDDEIVTSRDLYISAWKNTIAAYITDERAILCIEYLIDIFPQKKPTAVLLKVFPKACKRGHLSFVRYIFKRHGDYDGNVIAAGALVALKNGHEDVWNYIMESHKQSSNFRTKDDIPFRNIARCLSRNFKFGMRVLRSFDPKVDFSYVREVVVGERPCCDKIPRVDKIGYLYNVILKGTLDELERVMHRFKISRISCVDDRGICKPITVRFSLCHDAIDHDGVDKETLAIYNFLGFCPSNLGFGILSEYITHLPLANAIRFLAAIGMDRKFMLATECALVTQAASDNNIALLKWMFREYALTHRDMLIYPLDCSPFGVACFGGHLECATFLYGKIRNALPRNPRSKSYAYLCYTCDNTEIREFFALRLGIPIENKAFIRAGENSDAEESDSEMAIDGINSDNENECTDASPGCHISQSLQNTPNELEREGDEELETNTSTPKPPPSSPRFFYRTTRFPSDNIDE